ncbi:alkaline phosphatase family protein [Deinococcus malanensis]|uniref:alkaline phosphatase family protein n=1 Tax=Deinococcus malanensis TaxID=1706855 RepID=UPI00363EB246
MIGEHGLGSATSVFPSTTMAALTTLHTGRAPAEHGYLGLSVWLEELGRVVNLIRLQDAADRQPVTGASFLAAVPSIYQQLSELGISCAVVMPEEYGQSFLTRWCCAGASYVGYGFPSTAASLTAGLVRSGEPATSWFTCLTMTPPATPTGRPAIRQPMSLPPSI